MIWRRDPLFCFTVGMILQILFLSLDFPDALIDIEHDDDGKGKLRRCQSSTQRAKMIKLFFISANFIHH